MIIKKNAKVMSHTNLLRFLGISSRLRVFSIEIFAFKLLSPLFCTRTFDPENGKSKAHE